MSNGADLIQAAEAIERVAKQYEHFVKAAAAFKRIGSFEQAEIDTRARIDTLRAEEVALKDIVSLDQAVRDARARKDQALADEKAVTARLEARRGELKDVEAQAARTVRQAQQEAAGIVAEAQRKVDALSAEERNTREACSVAERELAGINEKIAQARAVQARLREQLNSAVAD